MEEDVRRGKALSGRDTVLMLFGLSSMFGILNFIPLFVDAEISALGAVMTFLFAVIWIYFAFSSGWNKNNGFILGMGLIWGISLLYLIWNVATNGSLFPKGHELLSSMLATLAFVMVLFSAATVTPLFQGLGLLGFIMNTPGRMLLVCAASMVVLLFVYMLGRLAGRNKAALSFTWKKKAKG